VPAAEPAAPGAGQAPLLSAQLVEKFAAEAAALGAGVICSTESELPEMLLNFLKSRGISQLLAWDPDKLPDGLAEKLQEAGMQLDFSPGLPERAQRSPETDIRAQAGLTGALAGIAATGTLVLPGGPGQPLSASLLPAVHIAILHAADIHPLMEPALARPQVRQAPALAMISGPSRTADIEMTLTIGVHGPQEVQIFCLAD
jgi:L-lactate dehydrogenase complex protein LldG